MSPHTASQKYSFDWRHVPFPASSPSLSPLQGYQPWQFPQNHENTGGKEERLLTTPLYGELHLHTFPRICWRSRERRKVRVVLDRPRLCRASSVDANVDGLKNSNTHQRIAKAIFFSLDVVNDKTLFPTNVVYTTHDWHDFSVLMLRPQELWSLKKLPFTIFVVHATTWKWLSLDSRRLWGFQSSCHATCKQRQVWPGAGGQQLGRDSVRRKFFFLYFRKKLHARATRNKENNNSGLISVFSCNVMFVKTQNYVLSVFRFNMCEQWTGNVRSLSQSSWMGRLSCSGSRSTFFRKSWSPVFSQTRAHLLAGVPCFRTSRVNEVTNIKAREKLYTKSFKVQAS